MDRRKLSPTLLLAAGLAGMAGFGAAPGAEHARDERLPAPVLDVVDIQEESSGHISFTRVGLSVLNWAAFPDELFEPAPDLPPCGFNRNASRTWLEIYDQDGRNLYGYCAMHPARRMARFSFAVEGGRRLPEYVYIELIDRRTGTVYTSEPAYVGGGMAPEPPPALPVDVDRAEFEERPPDLEGCRRRPPGTVCVGYEDGYLWLIRDSVVGWDELPLGDGRTLSIAIGRRADYHHVLGTQLRMRVPK